MRRKAKARDALTGKCSAWCDETAVHLHVADFVMKDISRGFGVRGLVVDGIVLTY